MAGHQTAELTILRRLLAITIACSLFFVVLFTIAPVGSSAETNFLGIRLYFARNDVGAVFEVSRLRLLIDVSRGSFVLSPVQTGCGTRFAWFCVRY